MSRSCSAGKPEKDDVRVTVSAHVGKGPKFSITSPVRGLFGWAQDRIVTQTIQEMEAGDLMLEIVDNQALDFVLAARIKTAVSRYRDRGAES